MTPAPAGWSGGGPPPPDCSLARELGNGLQSCPNLRSGAHALARRRPMQERCLVSVPCSSSPVVSPVRPRRRRHGVRGRRRRIRHTPWPEPRPRTTAPSGMRRATREHCAKKQQLSRSAAATSAASTTPPTCAKRGCGQAQRPSRQATQVDEHRQRRRRGHLPRRRSAARRRKTSKWSAPPRSA